MKYYFYKHKKWLIKHHGNCEDLGLNFFIRNYYKEKPVYIKGKLFQLNNSGGYSSNPGHYKIRQRFCKKFHNI